MRAPRCGGRTKQAGGLRWTNDLSEMEPLIDWNNNCGNVTMTYNAPLKRYFMIITDGVDTISRFQTYILESELVTGPWKLVVYMQSFGEQGYFVNLPFISADGRTAWLCYAANFKRGQSPNPPGSGYGMVLQEIQLPGPESRLDSSIDVLTGRQAVEANQGDQR